MTENHIHYCSYPTLAKQLTIVSLLSYNDDRTCMYSEGSIITWHKHRTCTIISRAINLTFNDWCLWSWASPLSLHSWCSTISLWPLSSRVAIITFGTLWAWQSWGSWITSVTLISFEAYSVWNS